MAYRTLLVFGLLLVADVAEAQPETVVASVSPRETACSVGSWRLEAPEVVAPRTPLWVRFEGPAGPMPETLQVSLRGPSGRARRTAVYEPDDREAPICDSVGPRPCGPRGPRIESFGVVFDAASLVREGDYRLAAGALGQRPTCHVVVRVSRALAGVYRIHAGAQNTALFVRSHRTVSWQLVRAPLDGDRPYEHARAILDDPANPIEVDVIDGVDASEIARYFRRMRQASFGAVIDPEHAEAAEVPTGPNDVDERPLLSAVFYTEPLLHLSVTEEGFEIAWLVSAAIIQGGQSVVRIRGRALGRSEQEVVASYLGALHPSSPPALP